MRRVFKYGYFRGMDPICPARIAAYPELEAVRDATPEQRAAMDPGDLEDAQHQWAYVTRPRLMQECFEEGCNAIRPTPLHGYTLAVQNGIIREFLSTTLSKEKKA